MTNKQDLLQQIADGVLAIRSTEDWKKFLKVNSAFYEYSFYNCMLIELQYPNATRVAGYRTWQSLNRQVRKGEKAIFILAPLIYKNKEEDKEELRGFKAVPVFDISQTDGEELATIPISPLQGDDRGLYEALKLVALQMKLPVSELMLEINGLSGYCVYNKEGIAAEIVIESSLSPSHKAKTLAHELTHAILHDGNLYHEHREDMELEAESTAFIVLNRFGIDSGDYSFAYIAFWQKEKSSDEVVKCIYERGTNINKAAKKIIDGIEKTTTSIHSL